MKKDTMNRSTALLACTVGAGLLAMSAMAQFATAGEVDGKDLADQRVRQEKEQMAAAKRAAEIRARDAATAAETARKQVAAAGTASMDFPQGFVPYGKTEKVAFLGVSALPADEALSRQLGLTRGTGLLVKHVEPDSPAAGKIEEHDVLRTFEGQVLVNQEQLAVLVRTNKPGSTVTIELTRQAKPVTVTVQLTEKEMPALIRSSTGAALDPHIMKFLGGTNSPVRIQWRNTSSGDPSATLPGFGSSSRTVTSHFNGQTGVTTMNTDDHTFTLTTEGGRKMLKVATRGGKELFNGPVTTEEERGKIPASFKDELKELDELTKGVQINVGPSAD